MVYIYLALILLGVILTYMGIEVCNKYAPTKIRFLCNIVYLGVFIRLIILFLLVFWDDMKYIYYISPTYFLNFLVIPIAAIISYYIILRSNKAKFVIVMIISGIMLVGYIIVNIISSVKLYNNNLFGYSFTMNHIEVISLIYISIFTLVFLLAIFNYKAIKDKFGKNILIIVCLFSIIEGILMLFDLKFFPVMIVNDIGWILELNYCVKKLKR